MTDGGDTVREYGTCIENWDDVAGMLVCAVRCGAVRELT